MDISADVEMKIIPDGMLPCHDQAMPAMEAVSEGDESSCGSSSSNNTPLINGMRKVKSVSSKKRVSWGRIHTREFALVVGEHPLCQDGLPVSLDWLHSDETQPAMLFARAPRVSERTHSYVFPRRLSYEERRQRICSVSGLTEDQVKNDEIDLIVRTLRESWNCGASDNLAPPFDPTPLAEDDINMVCAWDDIMNQAGDVDFGDLTDFEWTD